MSLILIAGLSVCCAQDSLLDDAEALLPRLSSIDPDEREAARGRLRKLFPKTDALRKVRHDDPKATVAALLLAYLGHAPSKTPLVALLRGSDLEMQAAAAEALAGLATDTGLAELTKLLSSADPRPAFAAARAMGNAKNPTGPQTLATLLDKYAASRSPTAADTCRALACALGREVRDPLGIPVLVRTHLKSEEPIVREFAIAALANLANGVDEVRSDVDEKGMNRGAEFKKMFLAKSMHPEIRALLGNLLLKAGVFVYGEVLSYQTHEEPGISQWAQRRALDGWRRSVLLEDTVQRYKSNGDLAGKILTACGWNGEGDPSDWWDRRRAETIDRDVAQAIELGVDWLSSIQEKDGSWKYCRCALTAYEKMDHTMGTTALALYTLVKMGGPHTDKRLLAGVEFVLATPIEKITNAHTYTIALEAMLFAELIEHLRKSKKGTQDGAALGKYAMRLEDCAQWLMEAQNPAGAWTYQKPTGNPRQSDNSNTQFALLGLRAAANAGVSIPPAVWRRALDHWLGTQLEDGGWTYVRPEEPKGKLTGSCSMSSAGLYCTLIAKASLERKPPPTFLRDAPVEKAMGWFARAYPIPKLARTTQFGHVFSVYYDLYSFERAMMIGETERIGDKDWYRDGALFILFNQFHGGEWLDVTDTCFALLFLKRAFVPVATGGDK